jgi:hypothetical protein
MLYPPFRVLSEGYLTRITLSRLLIFTSSLPVFISPRWAHVDKLAYNNCGGPDMAQ